MNKRNKKALIKALELKIKNIEEEEIDKLEAEYKKLKSELEGLKKGFIIKKYKNFKILGFLGGLIIIISILLSLINFRYDFVLEGIKFSFDSNLWNQLFYFGLSILTISYIFYQIGESNKDKGRLLIAEMHIRRLSEIETIKKKEQAIQKMQRAIQKLDNLKSVSELENTKDEDLKFMYDNIYLMTLKNKLKLFKK